MKPRSWFPWIFGGLALLLLFTGVGFLLTWGSYQFGWEWTGVAPYTLPTSQYQRGKTLWDLLQLFIVPAFLAAGAGFFTWWSARTERQIAQQRYKQDQELALDKQREDLLQFYLDRMAELLLEKKLRDSQPESEERKVARTRTVSTLIQLDGKRARTIFLFLNEAQLREEPNPIIPLEKADFSSVKWSGARFGGFNLREADLSWVDFQGTDLRQADLSKAKLYKADLRGAILIEVNFSGAILMRADLRGATLHQANFSGADLYQANFSGADLQKANLSDANLLSANFSGAILIGVRGLAPEQIALCKANGAIILEEAELPSQLAPIAPSQEIMQQVSPLPSQAVTPNHLQEDTTVENGVPSLTQLSQDSAIPLSHSQEDTFPAPLIQDNTTPLLPSQDTTS